MRSLYSCSVTGGKKLACGILCAAGIGGVSKGAFIAALLPALAAAGGLGRIAAANLRMTNLPAGARQALDDQKSPKTVLFNAPLFRTTLKGPSASPKALPKRKCDSS